jgi:hypothetical protein
MGLTQAATSGHQEEAAGMNPTPGDVYVSQTLTNISVQFMLNSKYIATDVFPNVPVEGKSEGFVRYRRGDWFRAEAKPRAPATESAGGGWRTERDSYVCEVYAFHKDIDDQTRANTRSPFNLERDAVTYVQNDLALTRESIWASEFFATGVWGTDITGVNSGPSGSQVLRWNDAASDPIADIELYRLTMAAQTGYEPNVLIMGPRVMSVLKQHPDFIERIKYTQQGILTEQLVAALLGVDRILIPKAIINTGPETEEGLSANDIFDFIFGKHALLAYVAPSMGLNTVSSGATFSWTGYLGASDMGTRMKQFRLEAIASDRIEGEMAFDLKVIASQLGYFFNTVIA